MEIRDPIHGSIALSKPEVALCDSAAYQRLRAIKQLGFSEFSFPGATHNRFLHSIGVSHLAGKAFDTIFKNYEFSSVKKREDLRQTLRMGALLHDIGHGPLSHSTEEVMPKVGALDIKAYKHKKNTVDPLRQADHEDYTIKFITDSSLTKVLDSAGVSPFHIAALIDKELILDDDFFMDKGLNFRIILSQIVSSELDADRMDYLGRDAYFCGTNYGKVELEWLINHLSFHIEDDNVHLALGRRALYTFDDFLLSRHHMHLMVYFHHKAIIYEEMLHRYLKSFDCTFSLPADIEEYIHCTDMALFQHLNKVSNPWAKRIADRKPFKVLFELHTTEPNPRVSKMKLALEDQKIECILANSTARLSKYHASSEADKSHSIFVVDPYDKRAKPYRIEEQTEIFQKYEEIRRIERLYVAQEDVLASRKVIDSL